MGCDNLSREWQADTFPTLGRACQRCAFTAPCGLDILVWSALIPHAVVLGRLILDELIANRSVEVLLIHQEVVVRRHVTIIRELYMMSSYTTWVSVGNCAVLGRFLSRIKFSISHIGQCCVHDVIGLSCIIGVSQEVLRQVNIAELGETILIEQWRIESISLRRLFA